MDINELLSKHRTKVINIVVFLIILYFAVNIYKKQAQVRESLLGSKEMEIKKNEVLKKIGKLEEELARYEEGINSKEKDSLMNTLADIAKNSSVKIISLKPSGEQAGLIYTRYPFDLRISVANYHVLGKFISQLESHPDIYSVEVARISPQDSQEDAEGVKLAVDLKLSTIILNKQEAKTDLLDRRKWPTE